uniref:Uncharacterized protein n=1 Tax=Chromera velia CCMP2878 TaxID=1169474 RepID=A0A0G4IFG5_9ALVE|eukprot:Cvel_13889.t1-p1 / transcript=Cvel_13889.t1 / gene=Cvel_13889 / organism=Chromera_velia_CCMP2878 / gene_product=hypothetical protein / transcript_product=hypothetical protein / location=Cvel_scaffold967:41884-45563(+) / protein_length=1032 / sequence_SO=supercontig / SO=protein_coding / is_pseudo=false
MTPPHPRDRRGVRRHSVDLIWRPDREYWALRGRKRGRSLPPVPVSFYFDSQGNRVHFMGHDSETFDPLPHGRSVFLHHLQNVGSLPHRPVAEGGCRQKKCYWAFSKRGCRNGFSCENCHYCPPLPVTFEKRAARNRARNRIRKLNRRLARVRWLIEMTQDGVPGMGEGEEEGYDHLLGEEDDDEQSDGEDDQMFSFHHHHRHHHHPMSSKTAGLYDPSPRSPLKEKQPPAEGPKNPKNQQKPTTDVEKLNKRPKRPQGPPPLPSAGNSGQIPKDAGRSSPNPAAPLHTHHPHALHPTEPPPNRPIPGTSPPSRFPPQSEVPPSALPPPTNADPFPPSHIPSLSSHHHPALAHPAAGHEAQEGHYPLVGDTERGAVSWEFGRPAAQEDAGLPGYLPSFPPHAAPPHTHAPVPTGAPAISPGASSPPVTLTVPGGRYEEGSGWHAAAAGPGERPWEPADAVGAHSQHHVDPLGRQWGGQGQAGEARGERGRPWERGREPFGDPLGRPSSSSASTAAAAPAGSRIDPRTGRVHPSSAMGRQYPPLPHGVSDPPAAAPAGVGQYPPLPHGSSDSAAGMHLGRPREWEESTRRIYGSPGEAPTGSRERQPSTDSWSAYFETLQQQQQLQNQELEERDSDMPKPPHASSWPQSHWSQPHPSSSSYSIQHLRPPQSGPDAAPSSASASGGYPMIPHTRHSHRDRKGSHHPHHDHQPPHPDRYHHHPHLSRGTHSHPNYPQAQPQAHRPPPEQEPSEHFPGHRRDPRSLVVRGVPAPSWAVPDPHSDRVPQSDLALYHQHHHQRHAHPGPFPEVGGADANGRAPDSGPPPEYIRPAAPLSVQPQGFPPPPAPSASTHPHGSSRGKAQGWPADGGDVWDAPVAGGKEIGGQRSAPAGAPQGSPMLPLPVDPPVTFPAFHQAASPPVQQEGGGLAGLSVGGADVQLHSSPVPGGGLGLPSYGPPPTERPPGWSPTGRGGPVAVPQAQMVPRFEGGDRHSVGVGGLREELSYIPGASVPMGTYSHATPDFRDVPPPYVSRDFD